MACLTLLLGAALQHRPCTCEWALSLGRPQAPAPGEPPPHPLVHPRTHASQLAFHPRLPHSSLVCVSWCTLLRPTRRGVGNGSFVLSPSFGTALAPLGNVTALAPSVGIGKQCDSKVGVAVVASGILYVVTFFADGAVAPVTRIANLSEVVAVAVGSVSLGDTPAIVGCTASGVLFVVRVPAMCPCPLYLLISILPRTLLSFCLWLHLPPFSVGVGVHPLQALVHVCFVCLVRFALIPILAFTVFFVLFPASQCLRHHCEPALQLHS
jgi:hypothetical protein